MQYSGCYSCNMAIVSTTKTNITHNFKLLRVASVLVC